MTISFENDNDVIVYPLEKIIYYARRTQQIFVAQCVWWLASIIGLEQGLTIHIDNLQKRQNILIPTEEETETVGHQIHPDQVAQVPRGKSVSATPRDLTENQRLDRILDSAERVIQDSFQDRSCLQRNRVNPLPQTKAQLKKARRIKRLQAANQKQEAERNKPLQEIRAAVIRNLCKE